MDMANRAKTLKKYQQIDRWDLFFICNRNQLSKNLSMLSGDNNIIMALFRIEEGCRTRTHRLILSMMLLSGILCMAISSATADQLSDRSVIVNVMIDCELSPSSHNWTVQEEKAKELDSFTDMLEIMDSRNLNTSLFFSVSLETY